MHAISAPRTRPAKNGRIRADTRNPSRSSLDLDHGAVNPATKRATPLLGSRRDTAWAMSQENVEIVGRLITEIWGGATDPPDLASRVHPQVEIVTSPDFPEQAVLRGLPGFEQWTRRWSGLFEGYDLQAERFWEAGDRVVVALHERGIAARSGIPFDDHYAHVWTFLNGLVVRVQVFRNQEEALEAAGLRE
jgi:ketosteroid isomerase-like protein